MTTYMRNTVNAEQRRLTLEGYKNLSFWNDRDVQTVSSYDKIFLPVVITGWAVSLAQSTVPFFLAYIGGALLLTFWILLSQRYALRISQRFCIMGKMECCLGFSAHKEIQNNPLGQPNAIKLRWSFYVITIILGAWVVIIIPKESKITLDWSWCTRVVILGLIVLITLIITYWLSKKMAKKQASN